MTEGKCVMLDAKMITGKRVAHKSLFSWYWQNRLRAEAMRDRQEACVLREVRLHVRKSKLAAIDFAIEELEARAMANEELMERYARLKRMSKRERSPARSPEKGSDVKGLAEK